jgi:hypothetical protein
VHVGELHAGEDDARHFERVVEALLDEPAAVPAAP